MNSTIQPTSYYSDLFRVGLESDTGLVLRAFEGMVLACSSFVQANADYIDPISVYRRTES